MKNIHVYENPKCLCIQTETKRFYINIEKDSIFIKIHAELDFISAREVDMNALRIS